MKFIFFSIILFFQSLSGNGCQLVYILKNNKNHLSKIIGLFTFDDV